jgi:hypothetical protein
MGSLRRAACVAAMLAAPAALVQCQEPPDHRGTWLSLHAGGGSLGLLPAVEISSRRGVQGVAVRGLITLDLNLFSGTTRGFGEIGLLYGPHIELGKSLVTARAGPGLYWYSESRVDSGVPDRNVGPRLGLPVELQIITPLGTNIGAGLGVLGDINDTRTMWNLVLSLHLGDTR